MTQNIDSNEKMVRIGAGIAAGVAAFLVRSRLLRSVLFTASAAAIQSAMSGHCQVKEMLGMNAESEAKPAKKARAGRKLAAA